MKKDKSLLFFTLLSLSFLIGCKDNQISEDYSLNSNDSTQKKIDSSDILLFNNFDKQYFFFPTNVDIELKGKEGTVITIPNNILVYENGQIPEDSIKITLKEYYKLSDIIKNNLSTQTKDYLIETGGMIHIDVETKKGKLVVKEGKNFTVSFPNHGNKKSGMKLFKGEDRANMVIWDKIICNDIIKKVVDTIYTEGGNIPVYQNELDSYLFNSFELGWLNCDRIPEGTNTIASMEWSEPVIPSIRMIFQNFRSAAYGVYENNSISFRNIPFNEPVTIVGFYKDNNMYYYFEKKGIVTENMTIKPNFEQITLSELERNINSLKWDLP